jgi:hypothetical protein
MTPEAILLTVRQLTGDGWYRFMCPACLDPVEKPADRKIVALLVSAGVDLSDEEEAAELPFGEVDDRPPYPEARPTGPAFSMDDVLTFHFLLKDDAALVQALNDAG